MENIKVSTLIRDMNKGIVTGIYSAGTLDMICL